MVALRPRRCVLRPLRRRDDLDSLDLCTFFLVVFSFRFFFLELSDEEDSELSWSLSPSLLSLSPDSVLSSSSSPELLGLGARLFFLRAALLELCFDGAPPSSFSRSCISFCCLRIIATSARRVFSVSSAFFAAFLPFSSFLGDLRSSSCGTFGGTFLPLAFFFSRDSTVVSGVS